MVRPSLVRHCNIKTKVIENPDDKVPFLTFIDEDGKKHPHVPPQMISKKSLKELWVFVLNNSHYIAFPSFNGFIHVYSKTLEDASDLEIFLQSTKQILSTATNDSIISFNLTVNKF